MRSVRLIHSDQVENKLHTLMPPPTTTPATCTGPHPWLSSPTAAFEGKYDSIMNSGTPCYKKAIKGTVGLGQASVTWLIALSGAGPWGAGGEGGRGLLFYVRGWAELLPTFCQVLREPTTNRCRDNPRGSWVQSSAPESTLPLLAE